MFFRKQFYYLLLVSASSFNSLLGMHNANRYFPFLERIKPYAVKKVADTNVSIFFTNATNGYDNGRKRASLSEIVGSYDIKDVISSLQQVTENINNETFTNPFITVGGVEGQKFVDKSIKYNVSWKLKSVGLLLEQNHKIYKGLSAGASIPLMQVTAQQDFSLKYNIMTASQDSETGLEPLQDGEKTLINATRRQTHSDVGLSSEDSVVAGFGDLDTYVKWHRDWDYKLLMRKISLDLQGGVVWPTGERRSLTHPSSVPFMLDGHYGFYFDLLPEVEFKHDWKFGLPMGILIQNGKTKRVRMSVGDEPYIYSALVGDVWYKPGNTYKIAPYVSLFGLADGLCGTMKLTHLRHGKDSIHDKRSAADQAALASDLTFRKENSKWTSNYLTFQVLYDSRDAMKYWKLEPKLYAMLDTPFDWLGGRRSARTYQFTFGVELHF